MSVPKRYPLVLSLSIFLMFFSTLMDFPTQTIAAVGNFLVIQDKLHPVDVIQVIAGEDYRTEYAIQLYKQGYAKMLFFTGGWCIQHQYYHGSHGMEVALQAGVPRQAVAYDDSKVLSTYDEVSLLKKYLDENQTGYHSVMVVSDPFHMRRAQWTYRHILGKGYTILMTPEPF